jgi:hypothetical protein
MMSQRVLGMLLTALLGWGVGASLAHADIYTWVDASGALNVSNLPPPDGVQVTRIQRGGAPDITAREDAAREAARQAEAQALADRVRQLEDEIAMRQALPPPVIYPTIQPPPVIQYFIAGPQQIAEVAPAAPAYSGCDPGWAGCAPWWFPSIYPAGVFFVGVPGFRPGHPNRPHHSAPQPGQGSGASMGPRFTTQLPTTLFGPAPGSKHS